MTGEDVSALIEREIGGEWSRTNAHGCVLRRCLVAPVQVEFEDCGGQLSDNAARLVSLWLVLEERPEDRTGYKIVFGEKEGLFGLAMSVKPRDVFLGFYGTFLDAYDGM